MLVVSLIFTTLEIKTEKLKILIHFKMLKITSLIVKSHYVGEVSRIVLHFYKTFNVWLNKVHLGSSCLSYTVLQ